MKSALLTTLPKVTHAQFTANSQALLLARASTKKLTLWDIASATETPPLAALPTFSAIALSTDNRFIAMGTRTGIIAVESTQSGKLLWKSKADNLAVRQILFTHDSSLVFAAGDGWLRVFSASTGDSAMGFEPIADASCPHVALSPEGQFLAHSETRSNSVLVWHLPTRQVASFIRLPIRMGPIGGLAFGTTVRQLFIAQQKQATGWNAENGVPFIDYEIHGSSSAALIYNHEVLALARPGEIPALDIWSANTGRLRRSIPLPPADYAPLAGSPDGTLLALPSPKQCWIWKADKLAAV